MQLFMKCLMSVYLYSPNIDVNYIGSFILPKGLVPISLLINIQSFVSLKIAVAGLVCRKFL